MRANPGVDPWLPGAGTRDRRALAVRAAQCAAQGIVINIAAMRIFYYPPHKKGEPQVVYTHPIGIGKVGWRTPEGATKIIAARRTRSGACRRRCARSTRRTARCSSR